MAATADRSDAMEKAARLVQRGELDRALKAYVRLFEQDRRDWSVGNTLGDLYVRVGQSKEAIAHFASLAEQLAKDGFEAKARALYRKILRIQPDNPIARQRVDELDRQQGGSVSPFLKRVLETARASRETAEAEAAPQQEAAPTETQPPTPPAPMPAESVVHTAPQPEPPELVVEPQGQTPEPDVDESFVSMPESPEAIFATPPPAPEPAPPVVGLPATSAEWADEWAAVVPESPAAAEPAIEVFEEHEREIPLNDSILDIGAGSEVEAFRRMQAAADAAIERRDHQSAFQIVEQFLADRPTHILALEKLVEIGVDAGFDVELQSAQLRLVKACVETERYRQAWEAAADLVIRHPHDVRYRELLDRVGSVAQAHGFTFPGVPELGEDVSGEAAVAPEPADEATRPAPTAPTLHLVPPPHPEPEPIVEPQISPEPEVIPAPQAPQVIAAPQAQQIVQVEARDVEPVHIDAAACNDELLKEWSDVELTFDMVRNALLDEAAASAEERLAEATRHIHARHVDEAVRALEEAMCAPHLRVTAGAKLAQLYRDNDAPMDALACLEWVAEMAPATEEAGHELAYELAVTLEALGQETQALGVYRELLAEVGPGYRDIASRMERLAAA